MSNVVSKIKTSSKRPKRKAISEEDSFHLTETEVENFLKILAKLTHSPEEIKDLEGEDREDGTLDIIILAASKLNELLKILIRWRYQNCSKKLSKYYVHS